MQKLRFSGKLGLETLDFSEFDDAELLELVGQRDFDEVTAKQAAVVFYERHMRWFFGKCEKLRFRIPGGDAENFARDIFASVYEEKASTFSRQEFGDANPQQVVRAWLGRIANNRLADYYRQRDDSHEERFDDWSEFPTSRPDDVEEMSESCRRVSEMVDGLSDRNRVIVYTFAEWKINGKKIPSRVLQGLADELGMTSEGVRKVYVRFRQEVRESIGMDSAVQQVR